MSDASAARPGRHTSAPARRGSAAAGGAGDGAAGAAGDTATETFIGYRELLFSIVYNLLGSVADTEDVLQETWLSWARTRGQPVDRDVENPRAYMVRIAVNHALARHAVISRRRETYIGPWLPEPLVTDRAQDGETDDAADHAMRTERVSLALLVVLESLTPLERAVFVLHEVFGYTHPEIAEILDRTPSAIRQLAHRARNHVHARRPRHQADPRHHQQVTERFLAAALGGDLTSLMQILAPDVTLWTDGGGKVRSASLRPVSGREKVARLLQGYARQTTDLTVRYVAVNGDPSAVVLSGDAPFVVMVVDLTNDGDQVSGIYTVTNPDKLTRVRLEKGEDEGADDAHASGAP